MLKITKLNSQYGDVPVLKNVSLELGDGKIGVLMGPNGAGKSTLLKSIFNLTTITSGTIVYRNNRITRIPTHQLLKQGIAYVPQGKINFSTLTVGENLLMGTHALNDRSTLVERVEKIYDEFPALHDKRHDYAFSLSGGQQQMLAIGRALMHVPTLLLLDEPSLGLSPKLVREVFQEIKRINAQFDTSILIVEHNLKSALAIADVGFVMVNGVIISEGTSETLKNSDIIKKVFVGTFD